MNLKKVNINGGTADNPVVLTREQFNTLLNLSTDSSLTTKSIKGWYKQEVGSMSKSTKYALETAFGTDFHIHPSTDVDDDELGVAVSDTEIYEGSETDLVFWGNVEPDMLQYKVVHNVEGIAENVIKDRVTIDLVNKKFKFAPAEENKSWVDNITVIFCPTYEDIETTDNKASVNIKVTAVACDGVEVTADAYSIYQGESTNVYAALTPANNTKTTAATIEFIQPNIGLIGNSVFSCPDVDGTATIRAKATLFNNAVSYFGTKTISVIAIKSIVIEIDQTESDPESMISVVEDNSFCEWLRANTHRYLGKYTAEGTETICQLDDSNSNYYHDGSGANLEGEIKDSDGNVTKASEGDVWQRMPEFWYSAEGYVEAEDGTGVWKPTDDLCDKYRIKFSTVNFKMSDNSKALKWNAGQLIGVFLQGAGALMTHSNQTDNLYSLSVGNTRDSNNTTITQRGYGFHACTVTQIDLTRLLYLAIYRNTDSQSVLGPGDTNSSKNGALLGMQDSDIYSACVNFLGIFGFYGLMWMPYQMMNGYEGPKFIDRLKTVIISSSERSRPCGYVSKFKIRKDGLFIYSEVGGTSETKFCDYSYFQGYGYPLGFHTFDDKKVGIFEQRPSFGSICYRLAFTGNIIEETDPTVFKSLTEIA